MKKIDTLVGLSVEVYTDQISATGILEHLDDEKIILNNDGVYFLVYRNKISMISFQEKKEVKQSPKPDLALQYKQNVEPVATPISQKVSEVFAENGVAENNQYGSILPSTLISQQPIDPVERLLDVDGEKDEEFSVSMSSLFNEESLLARAERQKILDKMEK